MPNFNKVVIVVTCLPLASCGVELGWDLEQASADEVGEPGPDKTYYISEVIDYSAPTECQACVDDDCFLNVATEDFENILKLDGWVGMRKVDGETWPSHFWDPATVPAGYGKDDLYADAARVAVFAGHGGRSTHTWGLVDPEIDECWASPAGYRLGTLSGDQDSLFLNIASCGAVRNMNDPNDTVGCWYKTSTRRPTPSLAAITATSTPGWTSSNSRRRGCTTCRWS